MHLNVLTIRATFILILNLVTWEALANQNFVTVGDPNNPQDILSGCGSVEEIFQISKFEVSNTQYAEFLNIVAARVDTYGLYSPLMEEHFWGGIEKIRNENTIHYQVKEGYEKKPVTFVSYYDAIRYVNWLHYGKPDQGTLNSTEGDALNGAYDTSDIEQPNKVIKRNDGAQYFLPNCNEWTKAAFYSKKSGYMQFSINSNELNEGDKSINFYSKDGWAFPYPHLVDVDYLSEFPSPYGTLNQQGNVAEWVEEEIGAISAMVLGGSLFMNKSSLKRSYKDGELPDHKLSTFGFRVARKEQIITGQIKVNKKNTPNKIVQKLTTKEPINPEYTLIDYEGNLSDPVNGYGAVDYKFYMSRYALTNKDYGYFLNDVARINDKHSLYNINMSTGVLGGIIRSSIGKHFSYAVKVGYENLPVTYVSWFDIARYVNYLHFGKPNKGEAILSTTEGNGSLGAYDTRNFPKASFYKAESLPETRNIGAKFWIPTSNEWYKAAYFDPERFGNRKYWDYPNRSSLPPKLDKNNSLANYQGDHLAVGSPLYLSSVYSYVDTHGYFDILGMGGNVWEWLEDWRNRADGTCWRFDEWVKGLRGGSFGYTYRGLHSSTLDPGDPRDEYYIYGARIAKAFDVNGFHEKEISMKEALINLQKTISKRYVLVAGVVTGVLMTFLILLIIKRLRSHFLLSKSKNI
jgi:formylglycine-generating enzyme required for sulfatase activity